MPPRTPQLRIHTTGVFFCRWNGRNHYFTKKESESRLLYARSLESWSAWRFAGAAPLHGGRARPGRKTTVAEFFKLFIADIEDEVESNTLAYYESHLSRFVNLHGRARLSSLDQDHVDAIKHDMKALGYAKRTINHELVAIKRLFNWAADKRYIPRVDFKGVKRYRLPLPRDRSHPLHHIRAMLALAEHGRATAGGDPKPDSPPFPGWRCDLTTRKELQGPLRDPRLLPWLELNYYALLRPSEVVRLVHGEGEWVDEGVFCLSRSKTELESQVYRFIPLSERALRALGSCTKAWSRPDSYYSAVAAACGPGGPHRLRHSAATHLRALREAREDIDLLLGHLPSDVSLTYTQETWQPLRAIAGRLSLAGPG